METRASLVTTCGFLPLQGPCSPQSAIQSPSVTSSRVTKANLAVALHWGLNFALVFCTCWRTVQKGGEKSETNMLAALRQFSKLLFFSL